MQDRLLKKDLQIFTQYILKQDIYLYNACKKSSTSYACITCSKQ